MTLVIKYYKFQIYPNGITHILSLTIDIYCVLFAIGLSFTSGCAIHKGGCTFPCSANVAHAQMGPHWV